MALWLDDYMASDTIHNMKDTKTVRTRMAPSPTGEMHVGSMAILLKNYAFAKKHDGKFVLRIEDTDKVREVAGGVQSIQDIIHDYGLDWDEGPVKDGEFGPYIQSERVDLYAKYVDQLVKSGKAYYCTCSKERLEEVREKQRAEKIPPKYDRHCRSRQEAVKKEIEEGASFVVRLVVPDNEEITFNDLIRGDITFNSNEVDDQVLLKSDGYPTYHMAVVVDDHLMGVTHIMRGEEWISSTPKHILLYKAFGWDLPVFAHIPLFLNPDGKGKMSKRKGTVSAMSFLDKGYLPEAMLNFFMILGWTPQDQREMLSLGEYIDEFDPTDVSKNSVVFDIKKLDWINGQYIRKLYTEGNLNSFWPAELGKPEENHHVGKLSLSDRIERFVPVDFPRDKFGRILELVYERLERLDQFATLTDFFYKEIELDQSLLLKKGDSDLVRGELEETKLKFEKLEDWEIAGIEKVIRGLQEKNDWKKGQYFMMVRIAVTGSKATPPLFETIEVLGRERTVGRLHQALSVIG